MFGRPKVLLLVRTTLPDRKRAEALANRLVDGNLAACVHLHDLQSVYRWKGRRTLETEVVLEARTTRAREADVRKAMLDGHPYEVPLVESWPVDGVPAPYAAWARQATR